MNILYLIGNGFDVNLGMHTSYADFYEYYISKPSPSTNINALKENIDQYKETNKWSDLEKGLGLYTTKLNTVSDLREVYFDINDELKSYLKNQISTVALPDIKLAEKLKKDLANPGRYFAQRQQREINNFISPSSSTNDAINIITFNYTDTIEKILEVGNRNISLELSRKNSNVYKRVLHTINHIHGTLDDSELIMGVNDISQISKEEFRNDDQVLDMLVKPTTTLNRGDLMDDNCISLISSADLICIFGLSLGETDNKWIQFKDVWKRIMRLKQWLIVISNTICLCTEFYLDLFKLSSVCFLQKKSFTKHNHEPLTMNHRFPLPSNFTKLSLLSQLSLLYSHPYHPCNPWSRNEKSNNIWHLFTTIKCQVVG